jgi:hypothetical protein
MRTRDTQAVVTALGLTGVVDSNWRDGIVGAYADNVFVTPPLGDWTLAVGLALFFSTATPESSVPPILTKLSQEFVVAQYFATHRVVEGHCWALARDGKLVRGFCFVGDRGEFPWNYGTRTPAEVSLGIGAPEFPGPNEEQLMNLAGAWSIDPSKLESNFTQPSLGRLGALLIATRPMH